MMSSLTGWMYLKTYVDALEIVEIKKRGRIKEEAQPRRAGEWYRMSYKTSK